MKYSSASMGANINGLVLVVDDETWHRLMIEKRLRLEGWRTLGADSGISAMEMMRVKDPDVILLDMNMPGLNGLGVLRLKAKDRSLADIPTIILSGLNDKASRIEGLSQGAVDYLDKDLLEEEELLIKVKNAIHRYQREKINKLVARESSKIARIDPLTQIGNRRAFQERWPASVREATRYKYDLALLMIDVDHFKSINDTCGHGVGDDVLVAVATLIKESCRIEDTPVRWGGEEFAVLLPHQSLDQASIAAERLRDRIEKTPVGPNDLTCTVSIGVAASDRTDFARLREAADQAVYQAKRNGRNRVETWKQNG